MLFVLGLVVRVLSETGHQGSVAEIRVNSLQGLVSLVVIVDPLLGHLNLLGRVHALQVEPPITLGESFHHGLLVPVLWNLVVSELNVIVRISESRVPGSSHTATCAANFSVIVGGPCKGLSIVGSGAQGHGGDEDDNCFHCCCVILETK